jgi:hypothetical protein
MANRTLYVLDRDVEIWNRAQQLAYKKRLSLSGLVAQLLDDYVAQHAADTDTEEGRVAAKVPA